MPLILSLHSGQDFYVGDLQVVIGNVLGVSQFEVTVPATGRKYTITDSEATELKEAPDVFLSAGDRPQSGVARVAIDAPRSIPVLRGEARRNGPKDATVEYTKPRSRWA